MAKLVFREKFELEVPLQNGDIKTFTGTVRELTKQEVNEFQGKAKESKTLLRNIDKKRKQFERLKEKIDRNKDKWTESEIEQHYQEFDRLEEEVISMSEELENSTIVEEAFKARFEKTVECEEMSELIQVCEKYSYEKVIKTIAEDVEGKKPKDTKN